MLSKLSTFTFHGVELKEVNNSNQAVGDCPFCGKEGHFYVNAKTGQWDCKSGGKSGNLYTFLDEFYKACRESTEDREYKKLTRLRSLPAKAFSAYDLALDGDRWLIPVHNLDGSIANLLVWPGSGPPLSTPGCVLHLLNGYRVKGQDTPIYVCEGPWDTIALDWLVRTLKKPISVVGVPSAQVFKEDWIEPVFKGREVVLLYDNDSAGDRGSKKAAGLLQQVASSVAHVQWPSKAPEGFDINDFVSQRIKAPTKAWRELEGLLRIEKGVSSPALKPLTRRPPAFSTIVRKFKEHLHVDKNTEDALAVMLATALSIQLPGDPIWLFVVGPPGAGKTLILRSLEASSCCHFESTLTAHTLVSGFRAPNNEDPSLIPKVAGKCLILKDYTEIKAMPQMLQEEIYGVLRGAYDGEVEKTFGNLVQRVYHNCWFSLIAGVTDIIHGDSRATLGERFLKIEFITSLHDDEAHIRAAITAMDTLLEAEEKLRGLIASFLERDLTLIKTPSVPPWVINRIVPLSQVIAYLRASVHRSRQREILYRPRPEIGTRLSKQLVKLARCLAIVYGKPQVNMQCYRLVERIAFDTSTGWHLDIVRTLMRHYPVPITAANLSEEAIIPSSSLSQKLDDLRELRIVERHRIHCKKVGQPAWFYRITDELAALWKRAKVDH